MAGVGAWILAPFAKPHGSMPECLHIVSSEKEHTGVPCWVQLTVLSTGLKLGRVVLPVFRDQVNVLTPQAGAIRIGAHDPKKMAPEGGVGY